MAKKKKVIIGSVVKGLQEKDSNGNLLWLDEEKTKKKLKPDYIKINGDHTLRSGQCLNLETKQSQVASIEAAVEAGRLNPEYAEEMIKKIENVPDFVRFQVTALIDV